MEYPSGNASGKSVENVDNFEQFNYLRLATMINNYRRGAASIPI